MPPARPSSWRRTRPGRKGAKEARRDWLLCLDDGDIPQEGWIRVLDRFVALSQARARAGADAAAARRRDRRAPEPVRILIRPRRRPRPSPRPHERDEGARARTPCRDRRARSHFPLRTSDASLISDNRVLSGRRARLRAQPDPFRGRRGARPRRDLPARASAPGGAGPPARHREPRGLVLCHGPARAGVLARAAGSQRSPASVAGLPRSGRGDAQRRPLPARSPGTCWTGAGTSCMRRSAVRSRRARRRCSIRTSGVP